MDLTTGRNLVESAESIYIKKMMDGHLAETIAQEKLITTQDRCRKKVRQVRRKLYMEIWPESLAHQTDMDIDKGSLIQRYNIKKSKLRFPEVLL